jgi:hypothetical protein
MLEQGRPQRVGWDKIVLRDFSGETPGSWVRCVVGVGYTGCEGIAGLIYHLFCWRSVMLNKPFSSFSQFLSYPLTLCLALGIAVTAAAQSAAPAESVSRAEDSNAPLF